MNTNQGYVFIDGAKTPINSQRNLLEVIRGSGVDLPTFCYCSELSVYGACRMCVVEVEGKGLQASCSLPPENGMAVKTTTAATQRIRKMALELLLANHQGKCQTCDKNLNCRLQELAEKLGVKEVRFPESRKSLPIDDCNPSLVRDPNKCILCGDCVRMCKEVQGIGVLDFAGRGSDVRVTPAFEKNLSDVECVYCGQCASVCPTGALTVKSRINDVWKALHNPEVTVVAQVAPAVRSAIALEFGLQEGEQAMAKAVTALRRMGFDKVFDTSFAADLTTVEEATEFLGRVETGEKLPQFTSCCPAWVKYAEQFYPDLQDNLSSCRSPQQMFGSLVKKFLPEMMETTRENMYVVSIMPCTAKKFEAERPEFSVDGNPDVDVVLSTQELIRMIRESGLQLRELPPGAMDMPFGFKTGAGVIFGASGGVAEAVLRMAAARAGLDYQYLDLESVRGLDGVKSALVDVNGRTIRVGIVSGLANTKQLLQEMQAGAIQFDIVEVMACRGGCIGGGGQPLPNDMKSRQERAGMLYDCDAILPLHNAEENPFVQEVYEKWLGTPNSHLAHELLHTTYGSRRRLDANKVHFSDQPKEGRVPVSVCVGTNCYLNGSYDTLKALMDLAEKEGVKDEFEFKATFCFENCKASPNVEVGDELHGNVTPANVVEFFNSVVLPSRSNGKVKA